MRETFADKVRKLCRELGAAGREFGTDELAERLDMVFAQHKKPLYKALHDFEKCGEIQRVRRGVYRYKGKNKPPETQERMWRILRARRKVTVTDLQELAGADANYAREWLRMLGRNGVVKKAATTDGAFVFRMVSDPVVMPRNEKKAERLRRIREKKKIALEMTDRLYATALEIRMAINSIPEEDS